jgi:hypothetical protein
VRSQLDFYDRVEPGVSKEPAINGQIWETLRGADQSGFDVFAGETVSRVIDGGGYF